jgi:hypothetical protein
MSIDTSPDACYAQITQHFAIGDDFITTNGKRLSTFKYQIPLCMAAHTKRKQGPSWS